MSQPDGGLGLSYHAQISADAEHRLIVGVAITHEPNDYTKLLPAVERREQRPKKKPQQVVTDAG